jgi:hypothetical protein
MTHRVSVMRRVVLIVTILGLGVIAWITFNRVRSLMMLGCVDSAIGRVRAVVGAEDQFARTHPEVGYTCALSLLPRDDQIARLVKDGTDNGNAFNLVGCQPPEPKKPNLSYQVTARPLHSGLPAFCSDQSGIVRSDQGGSVETCLVNGVPLGS